MNILVALLLTGAMSPTGASPSCPASHPYVYHNGQYCCGVNKEKVWGPQGDKCDGSLIQRDSLCCGQGVKGCPSGKGNCEDYGGLQINLLLIFFLGMLIVVPLEETSIND